MTQPTDVRLFFVQSLLTSLSVSKRPAAPLAEEFKRLARLAEARGELNTALSALRCAESAEGLAKEGLDIASLGELFREHGKTEHLGVHR